MMSCREVSTLVSTGQMPDLSLRQRTGIWMPDAATGWRRARQPTTREDRRGYFASSFETFGQF